MGRNSIEGWNELYIRDVPLGCVSNIEIYLIDDKWYFNLDDRILEVDKDIIFGNLKPYKDRYIYPYTLKNEDRNK